MIWKCTTWFYDTTSPEWLHHRVTGYNEDHGDDSTAGRNVTVGGHQAMVCQFHPTMYMVGFTIGHPYDPDYPDGLPTNCHVVGCRQETGHINNYVGTPGLGPDFSVRIDKFGTFGKAHQWYGKNCLFEDDVLPPDKYKRKLHMDIHPRQGLSRIQNRLIQARAEWNYKGMNPHRVAPGSDQLTFAPVTTYRVAGASKMRSQKDIEARKGTVGIQGRNHAHLAAAYLEGTYWWIHQNLYAGLVPVPWWRRQSCVNQLMGGLSEYMAVCDHFNHPQETNYFPTLWPPVNYDPMFEAAANSSLAVLVSIQQLRKHLQALVDQWNPEPTSGDYIWPLLMMAPIFHHFNIILSSRFNGWPQPRQQSVTPCLNPASD